MQKLYMIQIQTPPSAINASVSVWSFYFNMGNPTACLWLCFICFELCCYYSVITNKLPLSPNHLELSPSLSPPVPKTLEKDCRGGGDEGKDDRVSDCLVTKNFPKVQFDFHNTEAALFWIFNYLLQSSECGNVTDLLLFNYFGCFWYY